MQRLTRSGIVYLFQVSLLALHEAKPRGGQKKKVWTPSPKVVELDESIPKQVLTFFSANWEKRYRGSKGGGEGGGLPRKRQI